MNCQEAEPLLFAERDGVLDSNQRAALDRHYDGCPKCRQRREAVAAAMVEFQQDYSAVAVPGVDAEWRALRVRLETSRRPSARRLLGPLLWLGVPLGAAAALAFAFFGRVPERSQLGNETLAQSATARAEFVEVADQDASPLVYVDNDSGWLVVWAVDGAAQGSG